MPYQVGDFPDIDDRCRVLGITRPEGICILPRGFGIAASVAELKHETEALDIKVLMREAGVPLTLYQPSGVTLPYIKENDASWIGPVILVTAATLAQNPKLLEIALGHIATYVVDLFKGLPGPKRVRLSVVTEQSETKTTKKKTQEYEFDGPPEEVADFLKFIRENQ